MSSRRRRQWACSYSLQTLTNPRRVARISQVDKLVLTADSLVNTSKSTVSNTGTNLAKVRSSKAAQIRLPAESLCSPAHQRSALFAACCTQLHEKNVKLGQEARDWYLSQVQSITDWAKETLNPVKAGRAALVSPYTHTHPHTPGHAHTRPFGT